MDTNLNWGPHIQYIKKKITPRLNILKAIGGIQWGSHPAMLIRVYKGFIRPLLDWGSQAMCGLKDNVAITLGRLQYAALRCILGLMCTTPTNNILDLCGEAPLSCRKQFLKKKFIIKNLSNLCSPLIEQFKKENLSKETNQVTCSRDNPGSILHKIEENIGELYTTTHPGAVGFDYETRFSEPDIDTEMFKDLLIYKNKNYNEIASGRTLTP